MNQTHWQEVPVPDLEREALSFLAKNSPAKANDRTAASAVKTAIVYSEKLGLPDHTYIPNLSGYVQIDGESVKLIPAKKAHGITYVADCEHDPLAACPMFCEFLTEVLPEPDVRNFIQEYAGYALLGDAQ